MGFDGAATFSGDKTGVQRRLKELSPHALFVHCRCHVLQLASVQAANAIPGIKHVYTTLMTLWKFFHTPKHAESLKETQKVLNLLELKIVKQSDTHWLAHERCVKAVKASYSSIVLALENIYETSRALQTKHLDLSLISSLVDATLDSLDDAILHSANWFLQPQDGREELNAVTGIEVTHLDICSFQERVGKPFIRLTKIRYPAGLDPPQKMGYQPSMFLIQRKCPASLLMSYRRQFNSNSHWTVWIIGRN